MTEQAFPLYIFRSQELVPASNGTVIAVAPVAAVLMAYSIRALSDTFGGHALFRNDARELFVGIWGARKASRFRSAIRSRAPSVIIRQVPELRLIQWSTRRSPSKRALMRTKEWLAAGSG